jgi:hypothetical protein
MAGCRPRAGKRKRVLVRCYEPIATDPSYRQPWSDVWIRFKARPGRRIYKYGPTLISRPELHLDLRRARERAAEEASEEAAADLADNERIDALLKTVPIYVHTGYPEPLYPNIYTTADWIDRREAEKILQALMTELGFGRVKFVWRKTRFVIHPVSVG